MGAVSRRICALAEVMALAAALAGIFAPIGGAQAGSRRAVGAASAAGEASAVEEVFVAAANRGDYATACRLYSRRYLATSLAACQALYRWGAMLFGPYDYRIVRRRTLT